MPPLESLMPMHLKSNGYPIPNEFNIRGENMIPWNYNTLGLSSLTRENPVNPMLPFLQELQFGKKY
jgi:hypothetical protein